MGRWLHDDHYRTWTREIVIDRMREWAALHGEQPAAPDWRPYQAAHQMNDPERAARFLAADGHWPCYETVSRLFGTWTAGIVAAGFTPREPHGGGGNVQRRRARAAA